MSLLIESSLQTPACRAASHQRRDCTEKPEEGHPISTGEEFVVTLPTEGNREGSARAPSRADDTARDIDSALVRRARTGDRSAFDTLYHRTVERVYAICLRMSADRARAERLTQDAFVLAWRRLSTFRGDSAFTSWLHRLTVNVVLEDGRKERRRVARVEGVEDVTVYERAQKQDTPELRIALERAIATLPPGARTVLVLHDIEGYTHQEIAGLTGTAIGTTKAQLHRARRLLRAELGR